MFQEKKNIFSIKLEFGNITKPSLSKNSLPDKKIETFWEKKHHVIFNPNTFSILKVYLHIRFDNPILRYVFEVF